ncbi:MAG: CDP-diacylglycerol--glycerol-3-phosphate 3-phosphatidyltransferase [Gammaproteobacteria bacterium]|nr:CDP-diacylglycerol--glycerol-3-phosphate 3-phosphatidyltransferase [Gammaproteobacteria bacterium]
MLNIPNLLTLFRLVLIPFILVAYYWPSESRFLWAASLFMLAAATDWLDGFLARKLNQTTAFGAFLDPVADKITVAVALVVLVESYSELWLTLPAIIIISREIVISALREWMAETGKSAHVAVSYIGKIKTFAQMGSIVFLLATPPGTLISMLGLIMLYVAAALTLWSMALYLSAAWSQLKKGM